MLIDKINYYSEEYHNKGNSAISDYEFDQLRIKYNKETGKDIAIGAKVKNSKKVKHTELMGSLKPIYDNKSVELFTYHTFLNGTSSDDEKLIYIAEYKKDGVAVSLQYKNGTLMTASTRGDGIEGEDISEAIIASGIVPIKIPQQTTLINTEEILEIRGEIFFNKADFARYEDKYSNARNAVAGIVRSKKDLRDYNLQCVVFWSSSNFAFKTQEELLLYLGSIGFNIDREFAILETYEEIIAHHKKIDKKRESLPFEIDGLVIKVLDFNQAYLINKKKKQSMIAFKFKPKTARTKLIDIITKKTKTGKISAIGVVNEVKLGNTKVGKVNLYNEDFIVKNNIRINDVITIERKGDVVPVIKM